MKKKKLKERPQPGEASASREKNSAGSKRSLEQIIDHDAEVHTSNVMTPTQKKNKRRKISDSDAQYDVDAVNRVQ